jgi:hypothetical protein
MMGMFLKSNTRILKRKRLTSEWAFQFSKCPQAAYIRCCPFTLLQGAVDSCTHTLHATKMVLISQYNFTIFKIVNQILRTI